MSFLSDLLHFQTRYTDPRTEVYNVYMYTYTRTHARTRACVLEISSLQPQIFFFVASVPHLSLTYCQLFLSHYSCKPGHTPSNFVPGSFVFLRKKRLHSLFFVVCVHPASVVNHAPVSSCPPSLLRTGSAMRCAAMTTQSTPWSALRDGRSTRRQVNW